ncbi:protein mrp homolog [Stylonychia lemnae]|uniref:Protein mrp homolog n=1 Tax=Stylonychia lemnae TaxID=5949 RepID=A0A078B5V5_STYLE|nr:protein mrp homolog [Stylonychia lemnae]|eukprot:CDW89606.1 protein mrp homolog [Stylonychia lemnae]
MFKKLVAKTLQRHTQVIIPFRNNHFGSRMPQPMISSHRLRFFSAQNQNQGKDEIMRVLRELKDEQGKPIEEFKVFHSLEIGPEPGVVNIKLNLTQDYRKAKQLIQDKLKSVDWVTKVNVQMAPQAQTAKPTHQGKKGLQGVKNIIAVSSCKGGVGKSTVAVNLAFSMYKLGLRVGIFDADLYGPSLPTMISPDIAQLYADETDPSLIAPIEFNGVKAMSYGFASQGKSAIMRGPIASNLVSQLIGNTNWGDMDYLVIDFPPGTGDIQITLGQEITIKGAVIVTTPQKLSYVDVVKGIEMFDSLKVPTISVVENMSYYKCTNCETKHKIYGLGYTNQLKTNFGIKNSFEIPIMEEISQMSDQGTPFVLTLPDSLELVQTYNQIARQVVNEVDTLNKGYQAPNVVYDPTKGSIIVNHSGDKVKHVDPYELRIKCKCAGCIDEIDGRQILKIDKVPKDVYPTNIVQKGNYAVAMVWSDGHKSSIYPFERILSSDIAEKKI